MTCLNITHKFRFLIFYIPIEGLNTSEDQSYLTTYLNTLLHNAVYAASYGLPPPR